MLDALQTAVSKYEATKQKRKFSSFFKSLVIELDKDLYGPDNHLVEVRSSITRHKGRSLVGPQDYFPQEYKKVPFSNNTMICCFIIVLTINRRQSASFWVTVVMATKHTLPLWHKQSFLNCCTLIFFILIIINVPKKHGVNFNHEGSSPPSHQVREALWRTGGV